MAELKYLVFFSVLILGVPVGYILASRFSMVEKCVFFFFIFFTCEMIDINFFSLENYRGTSKGFEFGMVDIAMYIIFALILKRSPQFKITWIPPGTYFYVAYMLLSIASTIHSDILIYSAFELNKMIRMYLYFWIAYNYLQDSRKLDTLVICLGLVTIYIFLSVFKQKYLLGMFQNMGPFPHQNSLTMYMAFLGSISLSRVLNKSDVNVPFWFVVFGMSAFCVLATLSRAGLALFAINCIVVFGISLILRDKEQKRVKARKILIVIIMPFVVVAGLYKASDSILERFSTAPEESKLTRIYLAQAAVKMANENILGVGLNNFAHKINDPYPYGEHIPEEISRDSSNRGLVETAYLMIAAETGWLNLVVFAAFIFYFYLKNLISLVNLKDSSHRYISVAIAGCLTQIYLQTTLEWVIKQTNNFYQLMLIFAIIGVLSKISKSTSSSHDVQKFRTLPYLRGTHCVTTI